MQQEYKIRQTPANVFFLPCENEDGERWYDISLNGQGYPQIAEVRKMKDAICLLLEEMEKLGQDKINEINQDITKEHIERLAQNVGSTKEYQKTNGYIYVIQSNSLYKIGRAKHLQSRMKTYRSENPFGVEVVLQKEVDDYIGEETKLLRKFKNKKYRGEWFRLKQEDLEWIKQNI